MAAIMYKHPVTGLWTALATAGPPGPSAVSADAGNIAVLGSDNFIYVPTPSPPVLDHGGLTGLADNDHPQYQLTSAKGAANGYAPLDANSLIPTTNLPPLAVNEVFTPIDQAAMLALTAQRGDMAIRVDNSRTYVLSTDAPSVLANWKEVMAAGQVQSVNGQTGVVSLTAANVGAPVVATTTPAALTPDIAGAVGVGTTAARADHVHNVPAAAPTTPLTATTTDAEGSGASFARNDHTHSITTAAPAANVTASTTNAVGSAASLARSDHGHALTANVAASPLGAAGAVGTSAAVARADHVHIYPTAANVGAEAAGAVATHAGAADPHTGYQKESEKGAVNGYASLDSGGLVPLAQLPAMGVPDEVLIQNAAPTPAVGLDLWVDADDPGVSGAASTTYVDSQDALRDTAIAGKVSKAGDTITGPVVINNALSVAGSVTVSGASTEQHGTGGGGALTAFNVVATAVNIRGDDPIHVGTAASNAAVRIENVAAPVSAGDVANKAYVDARIVAAAARPTNTVGVTPPMIWIPTT